MRRVVAYLLVAVVFVAAGQAFAGALPTGATVLVAHDHDGYYIVGNGVREGLFWYDWDDFDWRADPPARRRGTVIYGTIDGRDYYAAAAAVTYDRDRFHLSGRDGNCVIDVHANLIRGGGTATGGYVPRLGAYSLTLPAGGIPRPEIDPSPPERPEETYSGTATSEIRRYSGTVCGVAVGPTDGNAIDFIGTVVKPARFPYAP